MLKLKSLVALAAKGVLFFGLGMGANAANTYPEPLAHTSITSLGFTDRMTSAQSISPADQERPNLSFGIMAGLVVMAAIAVRRKA